MPRNSIDDPRLDWGVIRSSYSITGNPSGYTAYLILWDAKRHGAGWFRENGPEVVGIFNSLHIHPGYADAFVAHEVHFQHHEASSDPAPLTDEEVIRLACLRVSNPIDFGGTVSEWRSVQVHVMFEESICVFYNGLFLKCQGGRYLLTLANLCRCDHEIFDSVEKITPADCREDDECAEVDVPQCGFRAEYCRALGHEHGIDPRWLTADVMNIARGIDEEGASHLLPILADALEEAGCDDEGTLAHCRVGAPHGLRCWVLDAVLGAGPAAWPRE